MDEAYTSPMDKVPYCPLRRWGAEPQRAMAVFPQGSDHCGVGRVTHSLVVFHPLFLSRVHWEALELLVFPGKRFYVAEMPQNSQMDIRGRRHNGIEALPPSVQG